MSLPDRLALDTNCFIYLFEDPPDGARSRFLRDEVLQPTIDGQRHLVASTLVVAELLVHPHRAGRHAEARSLRTALEQLPGLDLVPLSSELAASAAAIRGGGQCSLADAVHAATASATAEALLTNDRRLAAADVHVPVIVLDEVAAIEKPRG